MGPTTGTVTFTTPIHTSHPSFFLFPLILPLVRSSSFLFCSNSILSLFSLCFNFTSCEYHHTQQKGEKQNNQRFSLDALLFCFCLIQSCLWFWLLNFRDGCRCLHPLLFLPQIETVRVLVLYYYAGFYGSSSNLFLSLPH